MHEVKKISNCNLQGAAFHVHARLQNVIQASENRLTGTLEE